MTSTDPATIVTSPTGSIDTPTATKRRRGRPKSDNPLTNAERKRRWRQRHGEAARVKAREYMREYRKL